MKSSWKKVCLGDIISIKHGWAFPGIGITSQKSKNVLVTPGNFEIGGGFKYSDKKFFNKDYPEDYLLSPGDLIVTMTDLSKETDTLGYSALVPNDGRNYLHNQRIGLVQLKNCEVDKLFIYWLMRTKLYQRFVANYAHGTSVKHTSPSLIGKFCFMLPDIAEQKKISSILSALDKKIAINKAINKNLEATAQAIFKSWFIDFEPFGGIMPADWKKDSLSNIAKYTNGLAMQNYRPVAGDIGLPVLKIKELRQGMCDTDSDLCSSEIDKEFIIHDGDVIFSWSGSLLVDLWCGGICGLNQHLFKVTSDIYDKWFYYSWTQHHLVQFQTIASAKATTMGHIKRGDLEKATVVIPSQEDYQSIGNLLKPIYDTIISNKVENKRLAEIRDALLPKLMSGEIDVSQVKI